MSNNLRLASELIIANNDVVVNVVENSVVVLETGLVKTRTTRAS